MLADRMMKFIRRYSCICGHYLFYFSCHECTNVLYCLSREKYKTEALIEIMPADRMMKFIPRYSCICGQYLFYFSCHECTNVQYCLGRGKYKTEALIEIMLADRMMKFIQRYSCIRGPYFFFIFSAQPAKYFEADQPIPDCQVEKQQQ